MKTKDISPDYRLESGTPIHTIGPLLNQVITINYKKRKLTVELTILCIKNKI